MALCLYTLEHAYVVYIYRKYRPLNLCQNMQKKVKTDGLCTQDAPLKSAGVNTTVSRMLERLWKTTQRMLVSKVLVSTLSVASAVAGL